MEVFMHNLPRDLSDRGLTVQLQPFMQNLGIVDFVCEKSGKGTFGHVTFLRKVDGVQFLTSHGEEPLQTTASGTPFKSSPRTRGQKGGQPRMRARLSLLGKDVYCKLSTRAPDPITLRAISHSAESRVAESRVAESRVAESRVTENRAAENRAPQAEAHKDESTVFDLRSLGCGYNTFVGNEMAFFSEWTLTEPGLAKFLKRKLVIDLRKSGVQIRIPFSTIVEMVQGPDASLLIITLSMPPVFVISQSNGSEAHVASLFAALGIGPNESDNMRTNPQYRSSAIDLRHEHCAPYCLVYHLQLSPVGFREKMKKIASKNSIDITRHNVPAQLFPLGEAYAVQVKSLKDKLSQFNRQESLPFGILFSLQALVYNGYLPPTTVSKLADRLRQRRKNTKALQISAEAMKRLFDWINYPSPFGDTLAHEVEYIIDMLDDAETEIQQGAAVRSGLFGDDQNVTRTYRAVVTPTRITLHGPELTAKNRILRKFPEHQNSFIRVQFGDEGGEDLFFSSKVSLDPVYNRFREVLKQGISIAGRVYSFLGFSHSSLRAHSVWFCAPFVYKEVLNTHFSIIDNLGDFSSINSPARRAARIGQAFSETPFSISLDENDIKVSTILDVKSSDGKRIFSDGVGTLSEAAMLAIWAQLPSSKMEPTCFQIRYAGVKGMLSFDSRLSGKIVHVRNSMTKFSSSDIEHLEICDMASKPIPLVLNRQLIKIMEDMGAAESWFVKLQTKELSRIRGITANAHNAANFLKLQSVGETIRLSKFIRQVETMGIDYRKDRFLRTVVEAVVLKELRLLKHKARIPVDKGATLFGVMDEVGFLEEDEVYISCDTFPLKPGSARSMRPVLVTRSPALHPGDVQFAWATNAPIGHPLAELRNCIVFSQKGARDLPSQLSGGDLDGDIYNVIWDEALDLEPGGLTFFSPADYPRVEPRTLDRSVKKEDMADFFVDFMKTDHLGVIATRHMILADQMYNGTRDPKCIQLAQLHSTAVDFSKTGIPVELKELPRSSKFRPDFLAPGPLTHIHDKSEIDLEQSTVQSDNPDDDDGPRHKYYKSEKLLGKLYRAVDEKKIWFEDIKATVPTGGASFWDQFITYAHEECKAMGKLNWRDRQEEAERIRHAYDDAVLTAMANFSEHPVEPLTELEVFVGFIINKSGTQTSRQRDRSMKLRDEFERVSTWIVAEMRNHSAATRNPVTTGPPMELYALELCLACVHVGCMEESRPVARRFMSRGAGLQSFRIVAAAALVQEMRRCQIRAEERVYGTT